MGIPYPDDLRVSTDEQVATILFPCSDNAGTTFHVQNFVQTTEGADHLYWVAADIRIIITVQTNDPVRCGMLGLSERTLMPCVGATYPLPS